MLYSKLIFSAVLSVLYCYRNPADAFETIKDEKGNVRLDRLFSTKTAYHSLDRTESPVPGDKKCRATMTQGIIRHGARNPGKGDIVNLHMLDDLLEREKENIKKSEHAWTLEWDNPFDKEEQHLLVEAGEHEHYELAKRMKARFPDAYSEKYISTKYQFSETEVSRASHSASAYVYGIFEGTGTLGPAKFQPVDVLSVGKTEDPLLRFYDTCPKYFNLHDGIGSTTGKEQKAFRKTEIYKNVQADIAKKLNIKAINAKELHGMYRACSYETVHDHKLSKWCEVLGENALRVLEYHDDLKQWWKKSFAFEVNYKMACPLLVDMVKGLVEKTKGSKMLSNVRFAHAETIMPFVSLLGFYKDEKKLFANLTMEEINKRAFSSSIISPFSANVFFVLYECEDGEKLVKLLINEKEWKIPFCKNLYCTIDEITSGYKKIIDECDFDAICEKNQHGVMDVVNMILKITGLL